MDGTFSIIKKPFMQMSTIHAFIRYGNEKKMVPLCFVLMSSRTQKDYIRVLKHIKTVILGNSYAMKECVVDFEKSVWLAIEKEFGIDVKIFGCGFHWTQCIFRRIKSLGLIRAYRTDMRIRGICK
ncbi:uncharacterized protein LOC130697281 [Daphnia carinata]|uniref:uncharacterized protein LOC130697281 n=1 Tax=Daphnia carinata TaxID=120202 RepID=UPI0028695442|nr:uncharacterized protein LOC130697281 [Daphnia carinata]